MNEKQDDDKYQSLRQKAQEILSESLSDMTNQQTDLDRILHELNVYQVEIEIQNEELRRSQRDLTKSRQELKELFDFAPLGYLEINQNNVITRVNLMASQLFQVGRKRLIGSQITDYIHPKQQDNFYLLRTRLLKTLLRQSSDLRLNSTNSKSDVIVNLQAVLVDEEKRQIRISLTDISKRKRTEQRLNYLNQLYEAIFGLQSIKQISETALLNLSKFSQFPAIVLIIFQREVARINIIKRDISIVNHHSLPISIFQEFLAKYDANETFESSMPQLDGLGIANQTLQIIPIRHEKMLGLFALQSSNVLIDEDDINLAVEFATPLGVAIRQASMIKRINQYTNKLKELVEKRSQELEVRNQQYKLLAENATDIVLLFNMDGECEYISPSIHDKLGYTQDEMLEQSFIHLLHPDETIPLKKEAITYWLTGRNIIRLRHKDNFYLWFESQGKVTDTSNSEQTKIVTILRDITERVRAQNAEKQQRIFAEALLDVTKTISSTLDLNVVITQIFAALEQIIPYNSAFFVTKEEDNDDWKIIHTQNFQNIEFEQEIIDKPYNIRGIPAFSDIFESLNTIIISDLDKQNLTRFKEEESIKSFICIPIIIKNKFVAVLNLMHQQENFYNKTHIDNSQAFAEQASIAIRNAQLYKQGQNLAVLEERQYLAQELHDAVSQTLFSAGALAETLPILLRDGQISRVQDLLETLQQLTTGARAEMRNLLLELRPHAFDQANLENLINQLIQGFRAKKIIPIHFEATRLPDLSSQIKMQLFRITQSALNNVVQHADANQVQVNIQYHNDRLLLHIEDDGKGFDVSEVTSDRHGLNIMRERAEKIDASIQIHSAIGEGTTIDVTIQIERSLL
ncbi:MAG: PAS domain S-box protein [Phototrophicaceae bacterium]